ncbi:hypothetical protein WDV85_00530 [Pseudokineococcus sp. 5B2Z-1]|uniref:hypothetical protein n=1 Tax=Pseudokineococcus sp. 5B2Z-1 TaxID=3132744 RepID=UPI0030B4DD79
MSHRHRHHHRSTLAAALAAVLLVGGGAAAAATADPRAGESAAATTAEATASSTTRFVRTDAPPVLRVGAPRQRMQIAVQSSAPLDVATVSLVGAGGRVGASGTSTAPMAGRPTTHRADLVLDVAHLPGWGRLGWKLSGWRTSDGGCVLADATVRVDVRAHSQAALRGVKRRGDSLRLTGSLRAYHTVQQRMVPWTGRPVAVQRHDGSTWRTVATATTDRSGDVDVTTSVPRGSYLRLVAADTSRIWGVTSATVRL